MEEEEELKLSKTECTHILEILGYLSGLVATKDLLFSKKQVETLDKLGKFLTPPEQMYVALEEFSSKKQAN